MNVTCMKCGWVHFAVDMTYVISQTRRANKYRLERPYSDLNAPVKYDHYRTCRRCHTVNPPLRESLPGDCSRGVTLNAILWQGA